MLVCLGKLASRDAYTPKIMANRGGKREGSGRKSKAEELGLSALIDSVWKLPQQKKILKELVKDSQSTDFNIRHESRKLLLAYKFGKPTEPREIKGELVINIVDDSE